jgi:hypothetical protein
MLKDVSTSRTAVVAVEGGIKYFKKTYTDLSEKQINDLFLKYKCFHDNYRGDNVALPKVIKTSNKSIYFEHLILDEDTRFRQMLADSHEEKKIMGALHNIAKAFADMHNIFRTAGYVHGDPWTGNIYIKENAVLIIDADPPVITVSPDIHIHNVTEKDLADFLVFLNLDLPRSQWWRHFHSYNNWHDVFLKTYLDSGGVIDMNVLSEQIVSTLINRKEMVIHCQENSYRLLVLLRHRVRMTIYILLNKLVRKSFRGIYHIISY